MNFQIIIADDHPLFRSALRQAVRQALGTVDVVEADCIRALQEVLAVEADYDLVLLDLAMPGAHGYSGLIFLRGQYPALPVVVISGSEQEDVMRRAMACGASGFIPKSAPLADMTAAIRAVLRGERWTPRGLRWEATGASEDSFARRLGSLTPQQFRVLGMVAEGLLNKQIAHELNVSEATIKAHLTALFRKLGVRSRTQAVIAVKQMGLDGGTVNALDERLAGAEEEHPEADQT